MKKNWTAIAMVENERLQELLIAAEGEILEGLNEGFPQYFLGDNDPRKVLPGEDFVKSVACMERVEAIRACRNEGLPWKEYRSLQPLKFGRGETISYLEISWLAVWTGTDMAQGTKGIIHTPCAILVPAAALA